MHPLTPPKSATVSDELCSLLTLPARIGGLGLNNPVLEAVGGLGRRLASTVHADLLVIKNYVFDQCTAWFNCNLTRSAAMQVIYSFSM